jgi:hypothetical protein
MRKLTVYTSVSAITTPYVGYSLYVESERTFLAFCMAATIGTCFGLFWPILIPVAALDVLANGWQYKKRKSKKNR